MAKKKPTPAQLKLRIGKPFEDGSFRVKGGRVFDPDTGKIRKRIVPRKKK